MIPEKCIYGFYSTHIKWYLKNVFIKILMNFTVQRVMIANTCIYCFNEFYISADWIGLDRESHTHFFFLHINKSCTGKNTSINNKQNQSKTRKISCLFSCTYSPRKCFEKCYWRWVSDRLTSTTPLFDQRVYLDGGYLFCMRVYVVCVLCIWGVRVCTFVFICVCVYVCMCLRACFSSFK